MMTQNSTFFGQSLSEFINKYSQSSFLLLGLLQERYEVILGKQSMVRFCSFFRQGRPSFT